MARRFKTRTFGRRKRDLIWVNKIIELQANDASITGGELLAPSDWLSTATTAFERGTLIRVVGAVVYNQTANATSADFPYVCWNLYKDAAGLTPSLDPSAPADVAGLDMLHWDIIMLASTASGTNALTQRQAIDFKTKRRLDSGESIYCSAKIPADTVVPACNMAFCLRFLVDRT